jgi:hypothetical protein
LREIEERKEKRGKKEEREEEKKREKEKGENFEIWKFLGEKWKAIYDFGLKIIFVKERNMPNYK